MRKFGSIFIALTMICISFTTVFAVEDGAYSVYAEINYSNPETGEIEDGGTANAALGEGMRRSATSENALIEKIGDDYYVTIRLLLQSNTNNAKFFTYQGYNTYEEVSYEILAENAMEDSIDYRFKVSDPFKPIKVSMYVTPMGRDTLWYVELSEELNTDTLDFVVSVQTETTEETPIEEVETSETENTKILEEKPETAVETTTKEETKVVTEPEIVPETTEETIIEKETQEELKDEEILEEITEVQTETVEKDDEVSEEPLKSEDKLEENEPATSEEIIVETDENNESSNVLIYIFGGAVVLLSIAFIVIRRKK